MAPMTTPFAKKENQGRNRESKIRNVIFVVFSGICVIGALQVSQHIQNAKSQNSKSDTKCLENAAII